MTRYWAVGAWAGLAMLAFACGSERDPVAPRCGDGVVEAGVEECDDGNNSNDDGCLNTCVAATCGDGFVQAGHEGCDDANDDETDGCLSTCVLATCGNGVREGSEACDDGNEDDTDECTTACLPARCGDGFVQSGESCDDGNDSDNDGCLNSCEVAACGDGKVHEGVEACDDGDADDTDDCPSTCELPACGDGHLWAGHEACDDGDANSDTAPGACRTDCTTATCGDGVKDPGEACDEGEANSDTEPGACRTNCALSTCGDNALDEGEECDDGDANSDTVPNACRTTCLRAHCGDGIEDADEPCDDGNASNADACLVGCIAARCGDGVLQVGVEACDDGDANSDTEPGACRTSCEAPRCGDGVHDPGEGCDDGINAGGAPDACRMGCFAPRCGDTIVDSNEECDDGNTERGDGCSGTCEIECGNGIVDPGETCDDGNQVDDDLCNNLCQVEPIDIGDPSNPVIVTGAIEPTDPTAPRARFRNGACEIFSPGSANYETHYDLYLIHNPHPEAKSIRLDGTYWRLDTAYLILYAGNFDPENSGTGCFASDGAFAQDWNAVIPTNESSTNIPPPPVIQPGETFTLIVTNFNVSHGYGNYTLTISVDNECGDGHLLGTEQCDDGNLTSSDGCDTSCAFEPGFTCPTPGQACIPAGCGNGILEGSEACDDGNAAGDDGCSVDCQEIEEGYYCDLPGTLCQPIVCGDGRIDVGEECEEPNTDAGDGCFNCLIEGEVCAAPFILAPLASDLSFSRSGIVTSTFRKDHEANCKEALGRDSVYALTSPVAARWHLDLIGPTIFNTVFSMRRTCDQASEEACVWSSFEERVNNVLRRRAWLDFDMQAGETVFIFVDEYSTTGNMGSTSYTLDLSGTGKPILADNQPCDPDSLLNVCQPGSSCQGTANPICTAAICGDGIVDDVAGEHCDDSNQLPGDGCDASCRMEGDTCADAFPLASVATAPGVYVWEADSRWFEPDTASTTCSATTNTNTARANDAVAIFTAPSGGQYDVWLDTPNHNGVFYIHDGTCAAPNVLHCVSAVSAGGREKRTIDLLANQTVWITVDGSPSSTDMYKPTPWEGAFTLTVALRACGNGVVQDGESCDDGNLTDGDGCSSTCVARGDDCSDPFDLNLVNTSTTSGVWAHEGSTMYFHPDYNVLDPVACLLGNASATNAYRPEAVYRFVPPDTGDYEIEELVASSAFNAVLYVWDACPGASELACTNNGFTDRLTVSLTAGQTYYIVIDEFGSQPTHTTPSGPGNYDFTVTYLGPTPTP